MARVYGEFFHASGVAKELRNMMLSARSAGDAMTGMEWLYGKQAELMPAKRWSLSQAAGLHRPPRSVVDAQFADTDALTVG